jgi:hypothetical protein
MIESRAGLLVLYFARLPALAGSSG